MDCMRIASKGTIHRAFRVARQQCRHYVMLFAYSHLEPMLAGRGTVDRLHEMQPPNLTSRNRVYEYAVRPSMNAFILGSFLNPTELVLRTIWFPIEHHVLWFLN